MVTVDASVWVAAFDPRDRFHADSAAFLHATARRDLRMFAPALVVIEVACAVARLFRDAAMGQKVAEKLKSHPSLVLVPMRHELAQAAVDQGTDHFLRGADALYVATARQTDSPLVSWDREQVTRAGALSPPDWLARHASKP